MSIFPIFRKKPELELNSEHEGGGRRPNRPPDLEEVVDQIIKRFKVIGGKKRRSAFGNGSGTGTGKSGGFNFDFRYVLGLLLIIWGVSGFFVVDEREEAVVLTFGAYSETLGPGLHWIAQGVQSRETVDMKTVRSLTSRATLLTGDENIISVEYDIQFVISDIKEYLFNVRDQEKTVRDVVESSVREIVGVNNMDYLLTEGRSFFSSQSSELGQRILDDYRIGISLQTVNLISAQPPDPVQSAFSDANKAREDEQRYINEAEVYYNEIIPKARGQSRKMTEQATAYRFRVIESAEGETDRFSKVYGEYRKAPKITRERIYLESMEKILQRSRKIFIDAKDVKPILYLPSLSNDQRADMLSAQKNRANIDMLAPAMNELLK